MKPEISPTVALLLPCDQVHEEIVGSAEPSALGATDPLLHVEKATEPFDPDRAIEGSSFMPGGNSDWTSDELRENGKDLFVIRLGEGSS